MMRQTYNTKLFTWYADTKQFVAEASDIAAGGGLSRDESIFCIVDNHCNQGFRLLSDRTNNTATFFVSETNCDDEGDVRFWLLKADAKEVALKPSLEGVTVLVFND